MSKPKLRLVKPMRSRRGNWGGLTSVFIAGMLGQPAPTVKKWLQDLYRKLGRYPTRREIGQFIWEREERVNERKTGSQGFVHF